MLADHDHESIVLINHSQEFRFMAIAHVLLKRHHQKERSRIYHRLRVIWPFLAVSTCLKLQ